MFMIKSSGAVPKLNFKVNVELVICYLKIKNGCHEKNNTVFLAQQGCCPTTVKTQLGSVLEHIIGDFSKHSLPKTKLP